MVDAMLWGNGVAARIGKTLQSILGVEIFAEETLRERSLEELNSLVANLCTKLLNRPAENDSI